jgi:hypothetical protein
MPAATGRRQRGRSADHQIGTRHDRFHENIHGALARAHVAGKAHALAAFAGRDTERFELDGRLHRNEPRLAVGQHILGGLQHRPPGTAAADPAASDGAVGHDDRLGAGLGGRHRHGAHHGCQHEGLAALLELRNDIHDIGLLGHGRHSITGA